MREGVREGGREKKISLCGPLVVHYVVHITSTEGEREREDREREGESHFQGGRKLCTHIL